MKFQYKKTSDKKWPWQVTETCDIDLPELAGKEFDFWFPSKVIYFHVFCDAEIQFLIIFSGYAWDGCSGPVPTTKRSARASCVHDVLYQCMREGLLGQEYRAVSDAIFRRLLIEDGMWRWIAQGYYWAVRWFGASHCRLNIVK